MDEVVVGQYANQAEAEMWAELLRDQGIPCRVVRAGMEIAATGLDAWVPHDLSVRAGDLPRAREVLTGPTDESQ
jgi:Putative prokaryotic signal transducing protein